MDNTMTAKTCGVNQFLDIQNISKDCKDLATRLNAMGYDTTSSKCRARIKWLMKRGYKDYLKPFNDLKGNRGRKRIEDQLAGRKKYVPTADKNIGQGTATVTPVK